MHPCDGQTDRQTDGRTSRAKNRALMDLSAATTGRTLAGLGQDKLQVTGPARYSM